MIIFAHNVISAFSWKLEVDIFKLGIYVAVVAFVLLIRETLLLAWTNFAKHGDPTPPGSCLSTWTPQPQDSEEQVYWNIKDSKPQMTFEGNLYNIKERMAFWDKIFK